MRSLTLVPRAGGGLQDRTRRDAGGIQGAFAAGVMALLLVGQVTGQRGARRFENYQDGDLGISLALPGSWTRVPQNPAMSWVAARFLSDARPGERADVRVVVLPRSAEGGRSLVSPDPADPYSMRQDQASCETYPAFVEASTQIIHQKGKKFEVEEAGTGKSPIGPYTDYKVREGTDWWRLRRARVFEREGMSAAVEISMPAAKQRDLEDLWKQVVGSVAMYAATKRAGNPTDRWLAPRLLPEDYPEWRAMPAQTRRELRLKSERIWSDTIKRQTTAAWRFSRSKRFSVVSCAGASTDGLVAHLETFAGYLDTVLGPVSDDVVRRWVLRICSDGELRDVFDSFSSGTTGFSEVVLAAYDGAPDPLSYGGAQKTMFWTYLHDKHPVVGAAMPPWLREGLERALYYSSQVRGKKVDFEGDDWARKYARELHEKGRLMTVRKIAALDDRTFHARWLELDAYEGRLDVQCQVVTCFLLKDGHRLAPLQKFLTRYLLALGDACAAPGVTADLASLADAYAKASAAVFGTDDEAWRQIEAAYIAYVRG